METRWMPVLLIVALVGWGARYRPSRHRNRRLPRPADHASAGRMPEKMMEGKVKAVDQAKKQVTLEDGTMLTIPAAVQVEWAKIKPGSTVAASYVEAGQLKTVRKFEVKS